MNWVTVVGPLKTREEAENTMRALGESNHSVYSTQDGDNLAYFVERNLDAQPERIFGYSWDEIQAKQQRR